MGRFQSQYYTVPTAFEWVDSDGDDPTNFKSPEDLGWVARALENHTHTSGKGQTLPAGALANLSVATANLQTGSVTEPKLGDDAATARVIADGAIDAAAKVAAGILQYTHFATLTGDVSFGTDRGLNFGYGGQIYDTQTGGERTIIQAALDTFDVLGEAGGNTATLRTKNINATGIVNVGSFSGIQELASNSNHTTIALRSNRLSLWGSSFAGGEMLRIDSVEGVVLDPGGTPKTFWHSGNDGAASALDAGLLGGQLPAYYAAASSIHVHHSARVYKTTNTTCGHNSSTAISFDGERYDASGMHNPAVNPSRVLAPAAGKYLVTGNVQFASNGTGHRSLSIRLNGTTTLANQALPAVTPVSGEKTEINISTVYDFAQNDYVEMLAFQSSGGNLDVLAAPSFSPELTMTLIG